MLLKEGYGKRSEAYPSNVCSCSLIALFCLLKFVNFLSHVSSCFLFSDEDVQNLIGMSCAAMYSAHRHQEDEGEEQPPK